MSPKLRKMGFSAQKIVIFSQISVFEEIHISQKSSINRKNPTTYPSTTSPGATNHYNILLNLGIAQKQKRREEFFTIIKKTHQFQLSKVPTRSHPILGKRISYIENLKN